MTIRPTSFQVPPPEDWQQFERNMRDLFEAHWSAPATMHGRSGQPQHGVDVYGRPTGNEHYHGVQCKGHHANFGQPVTEKELRAEAKKATAFEPRLAHFILATTTQRDATIQAVERKLNARKRKPFTVQVLFWDDIVVLYEKHPDVLARHYPFTAPSLDRLHQLRPPVADFTGREDEIADLFKHIDQGVTISGVQGMGGIGKTELAYALADRLKDQYPDAQLYLDLRGTSSTPLPPTEVLSLIIRCFHPDAKLPDEFAQLQGLVRSALKDKRTLLLMDNAADRAQLEPLCPPPTGSLLLVTSRQHFALPGLHAKNLDTLRPDQARDLLLKICPRLTDPNRDREGADALPEPNRDRQGAAPPAHVASAPRGRRSAPEPLPSEPPADHLARLCGYLPLALRAAASALAERVTLTPADYIRRLTDEQRRMQELDVVTASLALSADLLPDDLRPRWYMLAVFPNDFDVPAAASVWQAKPDDAQDALDTLHRYSVLDWNPETRRFRLHDLVRTFVHPCLSQAPPPHDEHAASQRFVEYYAHVAGTANDTLKQTNGYAAGLALFDTEWPNIRAAFSIASARAAEHAWANEAVIRLAGTCVDCLDLRLYGQAKTNWLTAGLDAARRANNRQAEGAMLGNLGNAYLDLGDARKAVGFHEQHLEIARTLRDRSGEASALGNLGIARAHLGSTRQAIKLFNQQLTLAREIADRRAETNALGNLANAYGALGDRPKAIATHVQVLEIMQAIGDRRGEANATGNLAFAYLEAGDPQRALDYCDQHLALVREIRDRQGEGNALATLGLVRVAMGQHEQAIDAHNQQLAIARETGDRRAEANALGSIANVRFVSGMVREGLELHRQVLATMHELGDRAGEATASWNIGLGYEKLDELNRAAEFMQVLVDYEREIGHADADQHAADLAALRARLT